MRNERLYHQAIVYSAVALLGLGASFSIAKLRGTEVNVETAGTGSEVLAPASLEQLAQSSDIVVIGTFHAVTSEGRFYGYDEGAATRAKLDQESPTSLSVPFTDFEVVVERTISDDGRRSADEPLIVRMVAERNEPGMPQVGDRRLLFLRINPDNKTYGMTSFVSQIDINGNVAVYRKGSQVMLPFGRKFMPDDLIADIEGVVADRSPQRIQHQ